MILQPKTRENFLNMKKILKRKSIKEKEQKIEYIFKDYKCSKEEIDIRDLKGWKEKLKKYVLYSNDGIEFSNKFLNTKICLINKAKIKESKRLPIVICVVKNDLIRMKLFLNYYRKVGIKHFAILDDKSTDGTRQYLEEQEDVDLFESNEGYTTLIRQIWINRILEYYGTGRWYLILDSDELFTYRNMENYNIMSLIEKLEEKGINRMQTILLDMYSEDAIFSDIPDTPEIVEKKYSYYDANNIYKLNNIKFNCLAGGVRCRIFSEKNNEFKPYLTKYPLIKYEKEDIVCNSHYAFPFYKNFEADCIGVLRHYKFLSGDMKKYRERAEKGNFEQGSIQYKKYIELYKKDKKFSFKNENSKHWINSLSIDDIKIVKDWR